jgi:hypothetical protein
MEERYIICDTNVWYYLASNTRLFNNAVEEKLKLVPTAIALREIFTNQRTLAGKNDHVLVYLRRYLKFARIYMPGIYLYRKAKSLATNEDDFQLYRRIVYDYHKRNSVVLKGELPAQFQLNFESFVGLSETLNEEISKLRLTYDPVEDSFEKFYLHSEILLLKIINDLVVNANKTNDVVIQSKEIGLFLKTMLYFDWSKLTIHEKSLRSYEPNDFNDLFNLLYLNEGELFWTFEKKGKQNFKKAIVDSGNESYLFDPNEDWNKYLTNRG